ncbi:MAG: P-loop NTPase fold protein [Campylobacterales bacterium]|nr:P-loop NTPase fold protein [Campylobacterales bacterium]
MNAEKNIISPNNHIKEYLSNYLILSNPEYAILLSGKWGSGKTYFIENFIDEFKNDTIKFIKISLFGLKNTNSIDEEIFQNLHPLLGSKYAKLAGNILKGALKLGVNLDWNQDGNKDGTANIDLKTFNPLDFFSENKNSKQEIVFIFDDLERTEINLKEVLGYINYLVEQSNFKVIILANEEKIINTEYKEFKEKVIGKTFEVKHSFEHILASFIDSKTNLSKKILNINIQIIKDNYEKANYNNLRHISQILFDFEYFTKNIDEEYLKHEEFVPILINNFFAISIELKSANLTREELSERPTILWDFSDNKNKEKTNIEKVYEKYNIKNNPLFDGKNWIKILLDNSIQQEELNELISNLSFFLEKKENKQPSWVKIWHYRQLSDEDFTKNLHDVLNKFKNCEYDIPEHFIHVIALLIFFSKNQLCSLTVEDIKKQVETCITDKYQNHQNWKNNLFESSIRFNATGLGYMGEDDQDFRDIFLKIIEKNKSIYEIEEIDKQQQSLNNFLESIKQLDEKFLIHFLLKDFESTPILSRLNPANFTKLLTTIENKNISRLGEILHSRYSDNKYLNNKLFYCYLTDELNFWKDIKTNLDTYLQTSDKKKLNNFLLTQFKTYLVENIINKMEKC